MLTALPAAPASGGTDSEAVDAAVAAAVASLVDSAPAALDTLNELAAALGDDSNYAASIAAALAAKEASGTAASAVATHEGDTTNVHGIANTASVVLTSDSRLSDTRTPSAQSVTNATVSNTAAIAKSKLAALAIVDSDVDASAAIAETKLSLASDAAAATASRRTLGTGATQAAAGNHAHSYASAASVVIPGEYGDGSDGVINFDGSTTVLGLAPSSGVYTLTRDIFLADGSQVSGSAVVKCGGYRIFCNGTFTIGASAVVHQDGPAASGTTGGVPDPGGTTQSGGQGGDGAAGSTGGSGTSVNSAGLGGTGGTGGASSGGPGTGGGSAGVVPNAPAAVGMPHSLINADLTAGTTWQRWQGGGGGRAGNAAASSTGGGGGAGGRVLRLTVYNLIANGLIRSAGGVGGAAAGAGTGAGGGGGGGGGALILVYHTKSGTGSTFTAATNTPGGAGGAPQGAGKTGATGSNGNIYEIVH